MRQISVFLWVVLVFTSFMAGGCAPKLPEPESTCGTEVCIEQAYASLNRHDRLKIQLELIDENGHVNKSDSLLYQIYRDFSLNLYHVIDEEETNIRILNRTITWGDTEIPSAITICSTFDQSQAVACLIEIHSDLSEMVEVDNVMRINSIVVI